MKKSLIILSIFMSAFSSASELRSSQQIQSFNCVLNSAAGITHLSFNRDLDKNTISGKRNSFIPVSYKLESAGRYGNTYKSHITMTGPNLARNQYLSFLFNSILPTGKVRASGTIMLVTTSGSVFAPSLQSSIPVGTVSCASIVIK